MTLPSAKMQRYHARKAAGVTADSQVCRGCEIDKPASEYRNNWHRPSGLESLCRDCISDRDRADRFEMTAEEYRTLLEEQGHVCAICLQPEAAIDPRNGRVKALAVDHNHTTGAKRGLLCGNCNKGIGNLGDSPERLIAAAAYLMAYSADEGVIEEDAR